MTAILSDPDIARMIAVAQIIHDDNTPHVPDVPMAAVVLALANTILVLSRSIETSGSPG